jgi:hypothetical protein
MSVALAILSPVGNAAGRTPGSPPGHYTALPSGTSDSYFFQSWFHTYLVKARGFSETDLLLSSLPFFVAACAKCAGGLVSHALVKRVGLRWDRRSIGVVGLGTLTAPAGPCAGLRSRDPLAELATETFRTVRIPSGATIFWSPNCCQGL